MGRQEPADTEAGPRPPMVVIDFHAYARFLHSALRKP